MVPDLIQIHTSFDSQLFWISFSMYDYMDGLISIAKDAGLPLDAGSLNRNTPGILITFLSQFLRIEELSEPFICFFCHAMLLTQGMLFCIWYYLRFKSSVIWEIIYRMYTSFFRRRLDV